jgi:hypothetical protein
VTCDPILTWKVNCHVYDNTKVLYFDRALAQNAAKAGMCSPACTHGDCCPTCCDMCGETLVMYEESPGCCTGLCTCCHVYNVGASVGQRPRSCCTKSHIMLPCLKDAEALAKTINDTLKARLAMQNIVVESEMAR